MTQANQSCNNCRFWEGARKICRRYPPRIVTGDTSAAPFAGPPPQAIVTTWPEVAGKEWCGEWQTR